MSRHSYLFANAEAHLAQLRSAAESAGGPCWKCKYGSQAGTFPWSAKCRHPFIRRGSHSPITGKVSWTDREQRDVRSNECGAEGALFETARTPLIWWRAIHGGWWMLFPLALLIEGLVLTCF